jgi:hypothetical protein
MTIDYQVVNNAEAYRPRILEVAELFSLVFERVFPLDAWKQWYLENPYGDPLVALEYHNNQLVGHHALLPQKMVARTGESLRYFLSVSTMVHPAHRRLGGFLHMVSALQEEAQGTEAACILAFPNARSAPLFKKLCGYQPILQTEMCNWSPARTLIEGDKPPEASSETASEGLFSYPPGETYLSWRTRNNHAKSCAIGVSLRLVYKVIEPATLMILDAWVEEKRDAATHLASLAKSLGLSNVRLTRYHAAKLGLVDSDLTQHDDYVVRFFGFPLAQEVPDIRFSLLLSDVF